MKLSKKLIITMLSLSCITLIGCGSESSTANKELTGDQQFINLASKAINARWDAQDKIVDEETAAKKNQEIIETEIKTLEENKDKIENKDLLKSANDYIEGNKKQIEALKTEDYDLDFKYMEESEKLRKPALISMVDNFGLVINDNNKQTYTDFKAKATVINKNNEAETFAKKLATEINFEVTKEYDWSKCETTLENTTDINFDYIYYNVQFKDAEGVVVDDASLHLNKFNAGSKQKADVSTDKDYASIEVTVDSFGIAE